MEDGIKTLTQIQDSLGKVRYYSIDTFRFKSVIAIHYCKLKIIFSFTMITQYVGACEDSFPIIQVMVIEQILYLSELQLLETTDESKFKKQYTILVSDLLNYQCLQPNTNKRTACVLWIVETLHSWSPTLFCCPPWQPASCLWFNLFKCFLKMMMEK